MKQGAIFDQDGLIFDTEKLYSLSWYEAGEEFGVFVPEEFTHAVSGSSGPGMMSIIRHYIPAIPTPEEFWQRCKTICIEKQNQNLPEKPGLHEILRFFKENGVKMAVASSSPKFQVEKNLVRAGVREYFDAVVSGEEVLHGKPAPDIFLLAAEKIGIDPKDCYVFEDSINGIRAGVAAGSASVMIPDITQPDEEIRSICAAVCGSLLEVVDEIQAGTL